ncbi:disease resistance protein RGA2-like [Hibiscus syriacus]|uniref:disease resistance protein RGA2-like n=1 Tax=Hibiscus syriacus TaxID=106335 RepID=UPI0019206C74|nr:disease resistance protein RGA2-like [Hibiscus syriacus]
MTCKMHDLMHDLAESVAGRESRILDSNSNTSEVDEICRHITIDFQIFPSFKGRKSETIWNLIISNCRCLRVLELDHLNLDIVPRSVHKLKHLRYLDLSWNTDLQILPKSICNLLNLQVLKLYNCLQLKELPEKIEKLVNLTHLSCLGCYRLTRMPRGIGKLTSLQKLSLFVVDKRGSRAAAAAAADLRELGGLNNLRGMLWISNLGLVKNAKEEFRAANLKEKKHLESLGLEWGDTTDDEEKSLEDLQPHPNLKRLRLIGWRGNDKIPSWLSLLTNLEYLCIEDSPHLGERCQKDIGEDWHKIAHIPRILVNGVGASYPFHLFTFTTIYRVFYSQHLNIAYLFSIFRILCKTYSRALEYFKNIYSEKRW